MANANKNLLDRYFVSTDKIFWQKFQQTCNYPIVYFDYSENINIVPKQEVQSAHFSGRQYTLHCAYIETAVKESDEKMCRYIYHISDDTNHDAVMTFAVLEDILTNFSRNN